VAIKLRVAAHGRVNPVTTFDEAGKDIVDIVDRKRVVSAEIADGSFLPVVRVFGSVGPALAGRAVFL